jgi:hypothetical protein
MTSDTYDHCTNTIGRMYQASYGKAAALSI